MTVKALPGGLAQTRFLRTTALFFGIATVVFGALALPTIQAQVPVMDGLWSAAALLAVFGLPLGMAVAALWSSVPSIKRWAAVIAVAQLLVLLTWVPFMRTAELPADASQPWVFGVTAFGATGAAMAWAGKWLWLYLPATGLLVLMDRALSSPQPVMVPLDDALYAVMFSAVFAPLVSVSLLRGRELDDAAADAREETAAEAAHRAEHRQRSRVNALLHDQVLVTLLVAAQTNTRLQDLAAAQATTTLARIKDYESDEHPIAAMQARDFVWHLQAVATESDPDAAFTYEITDAATAVGADAAYAIAEGLAEALRNVLRHAEVPGRELHRAVHVGMTRSSVRVDVLDDGRGFDPTAVPSARLGIMVSIRERMATLPGGSSEVVSVPGQGTRVALEWTAG